MKHSNILSKTLLATAFTLIYSQISAGPGTLVSSPLIVGTSATSNIMFLVDNSLSMNMIAEESDSSNVDKYDSGTTYKATCTSPVASGQTVYIYITSNKPKVRFSYNSGTSYTTNYALAESASNICFDSTSNYKAGLNASNGTRPTYSNNVALYTGNYLNWYFKYDNTTTHWDSGQQIKPGTKTRKTIASESMTTLFTALESTDVDLRVGLSSFHPNSTDIGVKIFDEIKLLDSTQLASMVNNLKITATDTTNLGDGWGTPLGTSLYQIGRYYIGETGTVGSNNGNLGVSAGVNDTNGFYNGNIIIHPDATTAPPLKPVAAADLFKYMPRYDSSTPGRESPIQYWCQNNFAVVMTDGLPSVDQDNISSDITDYDSDCAGASPACANTTTGAASTTPHYDMKGNSTSYTYLADNQSPSDYFDDVAQALFEVDLRPDINDYSGNDIKNNVITYTIAFADQDALTNKLISDAGNQGGGEAISASDGADLIKKFTEVTNKVLAITSSAASVTFNTASLNSNTALFQALFTTSRWSGDILSYPVDSTNGTINTGCILESLNCWSAANHLDDLAYNSGASTFVDNRQIITFDTTTKKGIAFTAPADFTSPVANEITSTMIADLCAGPDAPLVSSFACTSATSSAKTDSQQYVERVVDYIRGDRTFEDITITPTFRTRQSVLGDVINATPAFAGKPGLRWPIIEDTSNKFGVTGNRYSDYKTLQASRTKALYVLANDGMLHAFRTEKKSSSIGELAGDELFAYMPSFIFSSQANEGYHYLAKPTYAHKYYLDLSPTYTDMYGKVKDSSQTDFKTTTADWHTILIGGSRGSDKKGIFALDITDPETITEATAADKVLWEFTNNDDADLGYTYSKPTIAMTNAIGADGLYRWAAIFGNGYQSDGSGVSNGSSCTAQLFVLFLDGGLDGTWTLGTNPSSATTDYMKIDTKVGTTAAGDCNGLSTPSLYDTDGDRILDRVYAGDVKGNMWAFDFTCSGGGGCSSQNFKVAYKSGTTPTPLFTTKDPLGNPQPIMVKPAIATNTAVSSTASNAPNLMVLFGTGKYHSKGDYKGTSATNTFYGVWDSGKDGLTDDRSNSTASSSTLVEQIMTDTAKDPRKLTNTYGIPPSTYTVPVRITTSAFVDWSKKYGWFTDLDVEHPTINVAEERVVVDVAIRSDIVFFNTTIPNSQICGFGGDGWIMGLDFVNGRRPEHHVFDVNRDGSFDDSDRAITGDIVVGVKLPSIPTGSSFRGDYQYTQTSDKSIHKQKIKIDEKLREGRLSWRELRPDN